MQLAPVEKENQDAKEGETTLTSKDHLHARPSRLGRVMSYLQTLSASAVDVERNTRALYDARAFSDGPLPCPSRRHHSRSARG
jgi:hypothetical protein